MPIAGAPRILNVLIASQTAGTSLQSISTNSVGSRVWSMSRSQPVAESPTQRTVRYVTGSLLSVIDLARDLSAQGRLSTGGGRALRVVLGIGPALIVLVFILVHVGFFLVFLGFLGINPGIELGKDVPDVAECVLDVARLERSMLTREAGDLGGDPQQVEVLPSHLQEDLALCVELKRFFESFLDLVLVLVFVMIWAALLGIKVVWAHRVESSRLGGLMNRASPIQPPE
jgi:hypothetical protein